MAVAAVATVLTLALFLLLVWVTFVMCLALTSMLLDLEALALVADWWHLRVLTPRLIVDVVVLSLMRLDSC